MSIANEYRVGALYILQIGLATAICSASTLVPSTHFEVVGTSHNAFDIVAHNADGYVDIYMLGKN